MALIIKKRGAIKTSDQPPAPTITEGAAQPASMTATPVQEAPKRVKQDPDAWKSWPQSPTLEHWQANRATHRPKEAEECKLCGNAYPYPCHGAKQSRCVNNLAYRAGTWTPPAGFPKAGVPK